MVSEFHFFLLVPCAAPNVTGVIPMTGKSFRIEWEDVPLSCQYGIIKGYYVYHQQTTVLNDPNSTAWFHVKKTSNQPPPNFMILDDLALKSNHTLMITAYTSKGPGVNSSIFFGETGDFSKSMIFSFLIILFYRNILCTKFKQ